MTNLTAEQQNAARAKKLAMNRTADETLAFLGALGTWDRFVEGRAKFWARIAIAIAVIGIPASIIWLSVKKRHPERGGGLLAVVIILVIVCGVMYGRWKGRDLSNNCSIGALPFLTVLREDMNPTERIRIKIDLRSSQIPEKKVSESEPYKAGAYHKVIDRMYADPWFEGSATLADRTKLTWEVTDYVHERQRTKRNPRGKIKTKTRSKMRTTAVVTLTFSPKSYAIEAAGPDMKQKKNSITLKRTEKNDTGDTRAFSLLIAMIGDAYSHVNVARSA